jgi:TatD DNase family protein
MIIDTHSHLNFNAYKKDLAEVLKRTLDNDIWTINVGTKYETSKQAVELAEKYKEGVYAAIGMHPIFASAEFQKIRTDPDEGEFLIKEENFNKDIYKELAKSKKVVAIGEIGLDYYYKPKTNTKLEQFKEKQKQVFLTQLDLAEELNLPVIIHCRMAHTDLLKILKERKETRGVIHCFTGNIEEAQQYTDLGFYLGINGIIDRLDLTEVIKNVSLNKILVETDCPYLTPKAEGDKRNEPIFVKHVIQKIADLRSITFDEVAQKTTENAKGLFNLNFL